MARKPLPLPEVSELSFDDANVRAGLRAPPAPAIPVPEVERIPLREAARRFATNAPTLSSSREIVPVNTGGPTPGIERVATPRPPPNFTMSGGAAPTAPATTFPISPEAATAKLNAADRLAQGRLRGAPPATAAPVPPAAAAGGAAPPVAPPASAAPAATPEPAKSAGWFKRTVAGAGDLTGKAGGALRTGAGFAGNVATAGAGLGIGAAAGAIQREMDARAPKAEPFVAPADAPGQIPVDPNPYKAPAPIQSHPLGFGPDNDFTRRTANTIQAIPGLNGLGTGLRASAAAIKGVGTMIPASAKLANLVGRGEQAGQVGAQVVAGARLGTPEVPNLGSTAPDNQPAPTPTDPRAATSWGSRPGVGTATPPPGGTVNRVGNSFSGENVQAGFGYTGEGRPGGLTAEQGGGGLRGGTVSSLQTIGVDGYQRQLDNIRGLGDGPNAGATGIGHVGGTESFGKSLSVLGPSGTQRPRDVRHAAGLASAEGIAQMRERGETLRAGTSQNNGLRIAELNNATARRSNDQNNQTSLRGQDMHLEGQMAPLKYQQAQMQLAGQYVKQHGDIGSAAAAAYADGNSTVGDHLMKGVSGTQSAVSAGEKIGSERTARSRALFNGRGGSLVDPGAEGEAKASALKAAEDGAHSFARQTVEGFDNMTEQQQQKLMPKIMGMYELHQKTKDPEHAGNLAWARNLVDSGSNSGTANSLRNQEFWKGGKIGSKYGALSGATSLDYERGDVDFAPAGKNSLRIAKPSDEALSVLRALSAGKHPLAD